MRVLIINKFLYPNGGSETYIFKLGEALEQHGHVIPVSRSPAATTALCTCIPYMPLPPYLGRSACGFF